MKLNSNYYRTEDDVFKVTICHYLFIVGHVKARCFFGWSGVHFLITVTTVTVIIRSVSIGSSLLFTARNLHSILYGRATSILQQVLKIVVGVMLVVLVMVVVLVVLFGGFV